MTRGMLIDNLNKVNLEISKEKDSLIIQDLKILKKEIERRLREKDEFIIQNFGGISNNS